MQESQDYALFKIQKKDLQQVLQFTSKQYVVSEPISVFLGTTPEQFANAYSNLFHACSQSGLSYCYKLKGEIVAVTLALDYEIYAQPVPNSVHFEPVEQLIENLEHSYHPKQPKKTVSIFIGCTHHQHQRKGLFFRLVEEVIKAGKEREYVQFHADCTNKNSENILLKLGFEVKARIFYHQYQRNGQFPFKGIKNTDSISVVAKSLLP